jgi:glycosyltransferase involved in cell wall biosynthesis
MQYQDSTNNPLELSSISVITVVMNDLQGFADTLESLEEQTGPLFNWVVVDSSSDGTSIPLLLSQSKLDVEYVWIEPTGIYPAMNQAAGLATGDYLYFLNAGDTFVDSSTLNQVSQNLQEVMPVWAFGHVNFWDQNGQQLREPRWDYSRELRHRFARGRFPAHQSVFVRKEDFLRLNGFDTTFTIAADYNIICRLSKIQHPQELHFVIANFTQGGASSVSWRVAQSEFRRVRRQVFPASPLSLLEELVFGAKAYASHLVVNWRSAHR